MRKRMLLLVLISVAVALLVAATWRTYHIRSTWFAQVIYSNERAYIFINHTRYGWDGTYFEDAVSFLKSSLRASDRPTRIVEEMVVFAIDGNTVARYVVPGHYSISGIRSGSIYAGGQNKLWKWTGSNFEVVTDPKEKEAAGKSAGGTTLEFSNPQGWSRKLLSITAEPAINELRVNLQGQQIVIGLEEQTSGARCIRLTRMPAATKQELWCVDESPHRTSRAEYAKSFGAN